MPNTTVKPKSKIRRFFSGLNKVLTNFRMMTFNILFVIIFIAIAISMVQTPINLPVLTKPGALLIKVKGTLVDQYTYQSPSEQIQNAGVINETLTLDLIRALNKAANDPMINTVIINTESMSRSGISKITEVGKAIENFKRSKKLVIAHSNNYSQNQYLLASYADEIWIHPMGGIEIFGIGIYKDYLKDGLDKLALKFHVFRSGEYKSATDIFTETEMPEANKIHNLEWLKDIWSTYQQIILANRPIEVEQLIKYTQNPNDFFTETNDFAQVAKDLKLVDSIVTHDQAQERLMMIAGKVDVGADLHKGSLNYIEVGPYLAFDNKFNEKSDIGLLVLTGNIHSGGRDHGGISSPVMTDLLRETRNNQNIKALVVRIDSGGGSAYASEEIRRELELISESGIPVYISMGSIAASGGYWIATSGKEIWADPATITGSIGVFGLLPNVKGTFDKMGIYNDGVGTTPMADSFNLQRSLNPQLATLIQTGVDFIYNQFIGLVAYSRNMKVDNVKQIAAGRVWSGQQAHANGLIDELGNLHDLMKRVASNEDLDSTNWKIIAPVPTLLEEIMRELTTNFAQTSIAKSLAALASPTSVIDNVSHSLLSSWLGIIDQSILGGFIRLPADPNNRYLLCDSCAINQ